MIKSSSSSHSQEEHPSPILPPLSCVSFPCVSILIAWPLTFSLCLPMSFSISLPHLPLFFRNNHCSVYGAHQGWAIKSALRLSCLFLLIQCLSFTLIRKSPAVFTGTKRTMLDWLHIHHRFKIVRVLVGVCEFLPMCKACTQKWAPGHRCLSAPICYSACTKSFLRWLQ